MRIVTEVHAAILKLPSSAPIPETSFMILRLQTMSWATCVLLTWPKLSPRSKLCPSVASTAILRSDRPDTTAIVRIEPLSLVPRDRATRTYRPWIPHLRVLCPSSSGSQIQGSHDLRAQDRSFHRTHVPRWVRPLQTHNQTPRTAKRPPQRPSRERTSRLTILWMPIK